MIVLLGEYNPKFAPHLATAAALPHSCARLGVKLAGFWISTAEINETLLQRFSDVCDRQALADRKRGTAKYLLFSFAGFFLSAKAWRSHAHENRYTAERLHPTGALAAREFRHAFRRWRRRTALRFWKSGFPQANTLFQRRAWQNAQSKQSQQPLPAAWLARWLKYLHLY